MVPTSAHLSCSATGERSGSRGGDPTPKYHRIRLILEERMLSGELPVGSQMPTEFELCAEHEVSRITARKALEQLRAEGLLESVRGRGTFVCKLPPPRPAAAGAAGVSRPREIGVLASYSPQALVSGMDDWGLQILRGMDSRMAEQGYHTAMIPFHAGDGPELNPMVKERIDELEDRLAGVLTFASSRIAPVLDELDRRKVPWITINPCSRGQAHNYVSADNHAGGREVGALFATRNYAPVLVVGTSLSDAVSTADRFFGIVEGYLAGGGKLEDVHYHTTAYTRMQPQEIEAMRELLAQGKRPQAVFCTGDLLASDVLKICHGLSLRVPEDVAVIGGTGLMIAEHTSPTLTVLAQPMWEMGREAADMLMEMIQRKEQRMPGRQVKSPLKAGGSCPLNG